MNLPQHPQQPPPPDDRPDISDWRQEWHNYYSQHLSNDWNNYVRADSNLNNIMLEYNLIPEEDVRRLAEVRQELNAAYDLATYFEGVYYNTHQQFTPAYQNNAILLAQATNDGSQIEAPHEGKEKDDKKGGKGREKKIKEYLKIVKTSLDSIRKLIS